MTLETQLESQLMTMTSTLAEIRKEMVTRNDSQIDLQTTISKLANELSLLGERLRAAEQRARLAAQALESTRAKAVASAELVEALETERESWRKKYRTAVRERDRYQSLALILERSYSFRIGRAIVLFVKNPFTATPKLTRAVFRLLFKRRPAGGAAPSLAEVAAAPKVNAESPHERSGPVLSEVSPVHAYVALGFDLNTLRILCRAIGQAAVTTGNHVPLIITDVSSFAMLRETGLAIEYIPDRESWEHHRSDISWESFRATRLARLLEVHQPARTMFVDSSDPLRFPELLALHLTQAK